ncbi:MAG TPA: outer membrane protein [Pseudolabrys sp.]|nr:outer membrane protein [Pseudolabrys sp.]
MTRLFFLTTTAVAVCAASIASAADLSRKAPVRPAAVAAAAVPFTWTGVYLGGHIGYGWANSRWSDLSSGESISVKNNGVLGGGQIGFNYQMGTWVVGLEADYSASGIKGASAIVIDPTDNDRSTINPHLRWTSLVTARLGYAFDRYLPYIKGGVAFGDIRYSFNNLTTGMAGGTTIRRTGWTIGTGLEVALDGNWSVRAEYDYIQFGNKNKALPDEDGAIQPVSTRHSSHQIRLGVNYRFGG